MTFDDMLMGSVFGLGRLPWRETPEEREAKVARLEERLAAAVDWTPGVKWQPELTFKASTYKVRDLFGIPSCGSPEVRNAAPGTYVDSPCERWRYAVPTLPRGAGLMTWNGSKIGNVMFDGPVLLPGLWEKRSMWRGAPWMSLTPAEILSLRPGLRFAKGHTVVAGLGLGHQLTEVLRKKSVTKVTLVESSQSLVDWLLPLVSGGLGPDWRKLDTVIVGNAYTEVPKLGADVCLLDIFESYGNNADRAFSTIRSSPGIKRFWVWGAAPVKDKRC